MVKIKEYTKKDGSKRYKFQIYTGINPFTGKKSTTTKQDFKTKKEAELNIAEITLAVNAGTYFVKPAETYRDMYDDWVIEYKTTVKESTYNKTVGYFRNHILPEFGKFKIDKISVTQCQRFVLDLSKKFSKAKTIMNYASMVFDYALKHEALKRNPAKLVTYPRAKVSNTRSDENKFYDKEHLNLFLSALDQEDKSSGYYMADTFLRVLALTGMRKGEALALTWNDIDFDNKSITINKGLTTGINNTPYVETPKTVNSIRVVDITTQLARYLKQWQVRQRRELLMLGFNVSATNGEQPIFNSNKNTLVSLSRPRAWMMRITTKYHLEYIHVHGLRHTHASMLFEAGVSLKQVQERLGHSDIKTTMNIYAHVSKSSKREAVDLLDKFLNVGQS